ncbi:hypothetical protein GUITHDRAFT_67076 [Guillardia theta CCMP2712]|uniref:CN hydrolase domain-containing protein n=1 Tax=Guillardia theta (strain CCMP2712) TaxID=905079 RepID=L1JPY8_GUITC|nr:hypothetical protein GUITHDRAFT_67076 [Guillardia theta CCMP2712]EKX50250.1 hypothetical protein GUITHDRAFT_67076 [Guillardia theta CCMP2712]|eukprot:XP_005837230.1 hypothetical protein GUITHDRAFT_67076 [Guillardia theta CCMP2712]
MLRHAAARIAVGQMRSTSDVEANMAESKRLCQLARLQGASFLSLPECFEFMGTPGTGDALKMAEPLTGEIVSRYRKLARDEGLWLSLGGFHERKTKDDPKIYNTHIVVDDAGQIAATYRKLHLFDVDYDGGFQESRSTHKGEEIVVLKDTPFGNIGITTCYDLRFPELFVALRDAGAHLILIPSAFMPTTGEAHWEAGGSLRGEECDRCRQVLLRARAIETQCYVAAAAQFGRHNEKRSSYGHALIVDPWGKVLQDAGSESAGVVVADLDFSLLEQVRARMPMSAHRR